MFWKLPALLVSICILIGTTWTAISYANGVIVQVAANTTSIQLQRWQILAEKLKVQPLTPKELLEYCQLSKVMNFNVKECTG